MSVLFGVFFRDGRPVQNELQTMYEGMKHFPHERHAFVARDNCGFGQMQTYNTPQAVNEAMPRQVEEARLLFTAEGRVDNRDELMNALEIPAPERAAMPDGDVMLKAYLRWGEDCVDHLEGKWSLAAFHTDRQSLFVARDKWDYTSLCYYMDDSVFVFCTSDRGIAALPFIDGQIDEMKVARLLVIWPGGDEQAFLQGIKRLLPSRTITVTRDRFALRRYWNYTDIRVRKGLTLADYVDDLYAALERAVHVRLRSLGPIAATLSGGMDSSTVCTVAARELAREGKRLRTYTHVPQYKPSDQLNQCQFGDEKPYVKAIVEAAGNIDPVYLRSEAISPLTGVRESLRLLGEPFHGAINGYWMADVYNSAIREGNTTVLMGEYGNATTSYRGLEAALTNREIVKRYGPKRLVKLRIVSPLLYGNTPTARLYKRVAFGPRPWESLSYCSPELERKLGIEEKIRRSDFDPTFHYFFADAQQERFLIMDRNIMRLPYGAAIGCANGLELRDPTGDPHVMESAFSIPSPMFIGEMDRWVLRTMMKGILPDVVRLNRKKGKQSADIPARLHANREEMDRELAEMEDAGFGRIVNLPRVCTEWQQLKEDYAAFSPNTAAGIMRTVVVFEFYRMRGAL